MSNTIRAKLKGGGVQERKKSGLRDVVATTDEPVRLEASADREEIRADGNDLAFITVRVTDKNGLTGTARDGSNKVQDLRKR